MCDVSFDVRVTVTSGGVRMRMRERQRETLHHTQRTEDITLLIH